MKNILIAGVGGQGTLLASTILGKAALAMDWDVKLSEVHGMAQRGGSVVTYVRMGDIGETVYSPLIEQGEADILLAFEQLEALRWLPWMKKDGNVYANTQKILPMPVITGAAEYPTDIPEKIRSFFPEAHLIDALAMAEQAGGVKAVNMVMIGLLAKKLGLPRALWDTIIEESVRPAFLEMNRKAFESGYSV